MDGTEVKHEPVETKISPSLRVVQQRKPDNEGVLLPIREVKQEHQEITGPRTTHPTTNRAPSLDLGEIIGTRFPRALYETPSGPRADANRGSRSSQGNSAHRSRGYSAQIQSSPLRPSRDRLMQAQLRLRRELDARAAPRGPTGTGVRQPSTSRGGRGTSKPDLFPIPSGRTSINNRVYTPYRNGQPGQYSNVVERLSKECQRRHFNLEWQFRTLRSGKFTCHVKLRDQVVLGNGEYECEQTAKAAVAHRALAVVQTWPLDSYWPGPAPMQTRLQAHTEAFRNGQSGPIVKQEGPSLMNTPGHDALAVMAPQRMQSEQQVALLGQMSSRANPEAAQAFLEGVAVGTRLANAGVSGFSMRDRSRSPANLQRPSPNVYRARSSPREDGRRHSPPRNRRPAISPRRLSTRERGRLSSPSVHDRWVHDRYRDDSRPRRS